MNGPTVAQVLQRAIRAHAFSQSVTGVVDAVRRAAGIYSAAIACHLSLSTRVKDYTPQLLDDAIERTRLLVRVPAMRGAIFVLPSDLVPHALVLARTKFGSLVQYTRHAHIDVREYQRLTERIEEIVVEKPRTAAEIRALLGAQAPDGTGLTVIIGRMNREGRIVRTRVRGGPRSQNFEYASMAKWIDLPENPPSRLEALLKLSPLWLQANGPATVADLAWWAGIPLRDAKAALLSIDARPVTVKGFDEELFATKETLDELTKTQVTSDEVFLLPCWDTYLMAHRDRSRYLDDVHRKHVVDRCGNVTSVILRGGRVVGVWEMDEETLFFARFANVPRRVIETAAMRLKPIRQVDSIEEVIDPAPLSPVGQNAFLSPLRWQRRRY